VGWKTGARFTVAGNTLDLGVLSDERQIEFLMAQFVESARAPTLHSVA